MHACYHGISAVFFFPSVNAEFPRLVGRSSASEISQRATGFSRWRRREQIFTSGFFPTLPSRYCYCIVIYSPTYSSKEQLSSRKFKFVLHDVKTARARADERVGKETVGEVDFYAQFDGREEKKGKTDAHED